MYLHHMYLKMVWKWCEKWCGGLGTWIKQQFLLTLEQFLTENDHIWCHFS